ncbi:MAG: PAS domain-containing protein [Candidatus Brocadiae bacterium]|nr:PAS domain-containing protein [Candidatus Brocadiia bacterium]
MARRRLLWKLYPTYILLILLCTIGVGGYAFRSVKAFYYSRVASDLEARARLIQREFAADFETATPAELDALAKSLGPASRTRVTIIGPAGVVLGDSGKAPATMDNHADRPEVIQARASGLGQSVRHSGTLRADMMYVALAEGGGKGGVVRVAIPLTEVQDALATISKRIWLGGLVVAVLAAGISMLVARRISRPLRGMMAGAGRFAAGDLAHKVLVPDTVELAGLAEALNRMAEQLDGQIRSLTLERNEREAILSSMIEGVMAVDRDQRVMSLNQAAASLLEVDRSGSEGRDLQEVARNVLLQRFVARVLEDGGTQEGEIVLHDGTERYVLVRGTSLLDVDARRIGALIVLHDVTRMRRLENVRRDFVANVSHELRTPVTAIQGFVETLREGALSDPDRARHFLGIVGSQAARLNQIIEDLLSLSRIEREAEARKLDTVSTSLEDVLHAAAADCQVTASERGVKVNLICPEELTARINPQLVEQAVANLVDNAVKNSESDAEVAVEAEGDSAGVVIRVRDHGCGIPAEHLPRIFERFYRVDKARSRKLGGTGLGLAIVKHIALAHGGRVTVESTPGEGSVFSIHLPIL